VISPPTSLTAIGRPRYILLLHPSASQMAVRPQVADHYSVRPPTVTRTAAQPTTRRVGGSGVPPLSQLQRGAVCNPLQLCSQIRAAARPEDTPAAAFRRSFACCRSRARRRRWRTTCKRTTSRSPWRLRSRCCCASMTSEWPTQPRYCRRKRGVPRQHRPLPGTGRRAEVPRPLAMGVIVKPTLGFFVGYPTECRYPCGIESPASFPGSRVWGGFYSIPKMMSLKTSQVFGVKRQIPTRERCRSRWSKLLVSNEDQTKLHHEE